MAENQIEQTKQYYAEKYISDKMIGYPRISEIIREHCSGRYVYAHANEGGERMSHYYRKQLPDGKWMCLRVADHDVDIVKTYLSYTRDKVPSSAKCANICLMFYGYKEFNLGKNWQFRNNENVPCLRVTRKEMKVFKPFSYYVYHFFPGLIFEKDVPLIYDMIDAWFEGNGNREFRNPLPTNKYEYERTYYNGRREVTEIKTEEMNPFYKRLNGTVKIENIKKHRKDQRNRRNNNQNESLVTLLKGDVYKLADIIVVDENDVEIGTADLVYELESSTYYMADKNSDNNQSGIISDEAIEDMLKAYDRKLRNWIGV